MALNDIFEISTTRNKLMDVFDNVSADVIIAIKRFLAWFLPSTLGIATKLAYDSRIKKLTRANVLTSMVMACFVGYICDSICTKNGMVEWRGAIVALGALGSESIIQYIIKNAGGGVQVVVKRVFNFEVKENPEENNTPDNDRDHKDSN